MSLPGRALPNSTIRCPVLPPVRSPVVLSLAHGSRNCQWKCDRSSSSSEGTRCRSHRIPQTANREGSRSPFRSKRTSRILVLALIVSPSIMGFLNYTADNFLTWDIQQRGQQVLQRFLTLLADCTEHVIIRQAILDRACGTGE